jgi:hypothetical protein
MYRVVKYFLDLQDNNYPYNAGDKFPRSGLKVTKERLAELAGSDNKQGVPLIQLVEKPAAEAAEEAPKKTPAKRAKKTAEE